MSSVSLTGFKICARLGEQNQSSLIEEIVKMGKKTFIGFIVLGVAMEFILPFVIVLTGAFDLLFNLLGLLILPIILGSMCGGAYILCRMIDKLFETPKTQPRKASKVGPKKFKDPWVEAPKPEETEKEDKPPKIWEEKVLKRA